LNRPLRWKPGIETFEQDSAADALLDRTRRVEFRLTG
jgi:hypothetical protein